jgi:hypothetical protein
VKLWMYDFSEDRAREYELPDEPLREFLNYLLTANRYKVTEYPELLVEKCLKLRRALTEKKQPVPELVASAATLPAEQPRGKLWENSSKGDKPHARR